MAHHNFITTTRGLRRSSPPMRLFEKAKRLGTWNPSDIDFSRDREDWQRTGDSERDLILRMTAMFQAGEEAVTLDLLPLMSAIAREGRLEEELYLTTFLFEEAKHTDFFRRFLDEVVEEHKDLTHYHTPNYRTIFYEGLPQALQHLLEDASPQAQARASTTYNMIVEGTLAETGYHAVFTALERGKLLPGMHRGIGLLQQDESRHIAYGIYLLSRLIAAEPALWDIVEETMNELLMPAIGIIGEIFAHYDPVPFGLNESEIVDYAVSQFNKRHQRLERAAGASQAEIERITQEIIERDDA